MSHEAHKVVNTRIKESLMQIKEVRNNYNTIKKVFKDDEEQNYKGKLLRIGSCNVLEQDLPLFVSLENVFTHKHREHITAYDYAMIPQMLKNIKKQNKSSELDKNGKKRLTEAEVIVSHLGIYYRLVIKKTSKNEAIVTSITQEVKNESNLETFGEPTNKRHWLMLKAFCKVAISVQFNPFTRVGSHLTHRKNIVNKHN